MNFVLTLKKLHTESASLHALILPENISKNDLPEKFIMMMMMMMMIMILMMMMMVVMMMMMMVFKYIFD